MAGATTPLQEFLTRSRSDDDRRFWLALVLALGFFGFIIFISIRPTNLLPEVLGTIVGYISGFLSAVVMFYFGSSSGSVSKSKQLAQAQDKSGGTA